MTCSLLQCSYVFFGTEMAQHEPVARIEALYRNEWPGSATRRLFDALAVVRDAGTGDLRARRRFGRAAVRSPPTRRSSFGSRSLDNLSLGVFSQLGRVF